MLMVRLAWFDHRQESENTVSQALPIYGEISGTGLLETVVKNRMLSSCTPSLFACIPAGQLNFRALSSSVLKYKNTVIGTAVWVKRVEDAHHAHMEHEKHEHGEQETPEYTWLNKRTKPFPWGNESLFFNPEVKLSSGNLTS